MTALEYRPFFLEPLMRIKEIEERKVSDAVLPLSRPTSPIDDNLLVKKAAQQVKKQLVATSTALRDYTFFPSFDTTGQ